MKITRLEETFLRVWIRETSAFPDLWSKQNPALGQCLHTAWVAKTQLGGKVIQGFWRPAGLIHFWNVLPSGCVYDFTISQFQGLFVPRQEMLVREVDSDLFGAYRRAFPGIGKRYQLFLSRFEAVVADYESF